jgi:hypothetical protein
MRAGANLRAYRAKPACVPAQTCARVGLNLRAQESSAGSARKFSRMRMKIWLHACADFRQRRLTEKWQSPDQKTAKGF